MLIESSHKHTSLLVKFSSLHHLCFSHSLSLAFLISAVICLRPPSTTPCRILIIKILSAVQLEIIVINSSTMMDIKLIIFKNMLRKFLKIYNFPYNYWKCSIFTIKSQLILKSARKESKKENLRGITHTDY